MLGIGIFLPISNVHADTQGKQHLKFHLTIDKSLKDKSGDEDRDRHEVTIPDEQVKRISKNGVLVIDGLADNTQSVHLSAEQMTHLIAQNAIIQIELNGIMMTIPAANFKGQHALTVMMKRVDDHLPVIDHAVGTVFDVTIKWGGQILTSFEHPITLHFPVQDHPHPEELRVYYWNEILEEWEYIGGEYEDDFVHAETNHFSIFGLFNPKDIDDHPDVSGSAASNERSSEHVGVSLPKTATPHFNFIVTGFVLFVIGSLVTFFQRRRLHVER